MPRRFTTRKTYPFFSISLPNSHKFHVFFLMRACTYILCCKAIGILLVVPFGVINLFFAKPCVWCRIRNGFGLKFDVGHPISPLRNYFPSSRLVLNVAFEFLSEILNKYCGTFGCEVSSFTQTSSFDIRKSRKLNYLRFGCRFIYF